MKSRTVLNLIKKITKRRATPAELGYERDPATGRLTKPGTKKHQNRVSYTAAEGEAILSLYRERLKRDPSPINEIKLKDRQKQLARKLENLERQRNSNLESAERKRKTALRKRQLNDWIKKLNSLLKLKDPALSVDSIYTNMVNRLRQKTGTKIDSARAHANHIPTAQLMKLEMDFRNKIHNTFYYKLHSTIIPTKFQNMTAQGAHKLLQEVSKSTEKEILDSLKK